MANMNCLPPEILLQIFRKYLVTETQYDFIYCVGKVCQKWQDLCKDPSLWQEFDGTLPFEVLKEYCNEGILEKCKILVFSEMRNDNFPTAKEIQRVYESLPQLNCVNFSNVVGIRSEHFFDALTGNCPELKKIVMDDNLHKYQNLNPGIVDFPNHRCTLFKDFLRVRGTKLVSLVFTNLYLGASKDLFLTIGSSCPNLEVLKVEIGNQGSQKIVSFPAARMQILCPKLRILCLGYPVNITNHAGVVGFKNLEIFRNSGKFNYLFPRCSIDAVIFESQKLKELDISQCVFMQSNCLHPVNYSHLEKLNISFGIVLNFACFKETIQKWSDSLKEIDVSNMSDVSLNDVFQSLMLRGGLHNLITLNLKRTFVTLPTVKMIVENCPQLSFLNLELCSELKEFSFKYKDKTAIKMLSSRLLSVSA